MHMCFYQKEKKIRASHIQYVAPTMPVTHRPYVIVWLRIGSG